MIGLLLKSTGIADLQIMRRNSAGKRAKRWNSGRGLEVKFGSRGGLLKPECGEGSRTSDNAVRSILARELIVCVKNDHEKGAMLSITLTKMMN